MMHPSVSWKSRPSGLVFRAGEKGEGRKECRCIQQAASQLPATVLFPDMFIMPSVKLQINNSISFFIESLENEAQPRLSVPGFAHFPKSFRIKQSRSSIWISIQMTKFQTCK